MGPENVQGHGRPHSLRTFFPILTSLAILVAALAPASAFHRDDLPVIHSEAGDGEASWALKLTSDGSPWAVDLIGYGPASGQEISVGAFFLDANKNLLFGFAFTGHTSPDRLVLSPAGADGDAAALPAGVTYSVDTPETDARCPYACVGFEGSGVSGTNYVVVWIGAVASTVLEVRGGVRFASVAGDAHVIGDAEIVEGDPNVQVQETVPGVAGVGLKVMKDASVTIDVADQLYGFWGASDFKLACVFAVGACLWKSQVTYMCSLATGVSCDTTAISWSGASGSGSGYGVYAYSAAPAGSYTFTVDSKVDAYTVGSVYEPTTGAFVLVAEDYSYLTVADVALPA